jgi:hypothetical protein
MRELFALALLALAGVIVVSLEKPVPAMACNTSTGYGR